MTNKIITSAITDPSILMPFTSKSLNFIQESLQEEFAHVALTMYGPGQSSISPLFITSSRTGNIYSSGYVFGGAFFPYWIYLEGGDVSAMSSPYAVPTYTWYTSSLVGTRPFYQSAPADPVTFSDNVNRNVHQIRKYTIVDTATPPTGSFALSTSNQFFRNHLTSAVAPGGSWTGNLGYRYNSIRGTVQLQGTLNILGSGSYTLPAEVRPVATRNLSVTVLDDSTIRPAICSIDTAGSVTFTGNFAGTTTRNVYMDGAQFMIAN